MQELKGKTVYELLVCEGQTGLAFRTDGGLLEYQTESDENAEVWFSDITGVSALLGAKVLEVEMREMPDAPYDDRTRVYVEDFFGIKLTTTKGYVDIVFRTSSNGYYGGQLGEVAYPSEQYMFKCGYVPVTDDWKA